MVRVRGAGAAVCALLYGYGVVAAHEAAAQAWVPQRHVEVTIPNAQGSSMDIAARTVHRLWQELKLVPVSSALVNRQGGEQAVAYAYLMTRAGDAHFLSFANPSLLSNHIAGRSTFTYTDFTPIAFLMTDDYIFAVRADHPLKNGREMVEAIRKRPDALSFGIGNITHRIALGLVLQSAIMPALIRWLPRVIVTPVSKLNTFCVSRKLAELCVPNRGMPPMSIFPVVPRPGTNSASGVAVLASMFCPIRVRLNPARTCSSVCGERICRYSVVRN